MSGIRSITRRPTAAGFATAGSAPIYVDSDDNRVKLIPQGSGTTEIVLQEAGGASSSEVVITTKAVTAAESGKTFYLDLAAGFVTTLPAVSLGLNYEFIVKTAPTGSYTIVCPAAATLFKGHVLTNDVNSGTDSDFGTSGEATITLVLNKAVAGDRVRVDCDGVNWHVSAKCSVFDAITIS
jgi:hypothetical protein